jgi:predicted transcriptional regulator
MRKSESSVEIGSRLKKIRIELQLQQKDIAETLDIASSYIAKSKVGEQIPDRNFLRD